MIHTFFFLIVMLIPPWVSAIELTSFRASANQDSSRVVLELSGQPRFSEMTLESPKRLVLDVGNLGSSSSKLLNNFNDTRIKRIRTSSHKTGSRIVFDFAGKYRANVFTLEPKAGFPHRLVVDVVGYVAGELASQRGVSQGPSAEPPVQQRDIVVAVDPGHGGADPGATSYGVVEKKIVLGIAKRIARRFQNEPGYRVVLTRNEDEFIRLKDRPRLARDAGADFFVSIHADSFPKNRSVRGTGVYALSLRGANSELSRWLQNTENNDDLASGADLGDVDEEYRQVLLDMSMDSAIRHSKQAGRGLLSNLAKIGRVHKKKLGLANFVVLRSPDIPSVLIETGFLSNRADAKRLSNVQEQDRIAQAIYLGIKSHFEKIPPPNTLVAWRQQNAGKLKTIKVKRGDTLSEIAMRYGISLQTLKELNKIESDNIRLGQRLEVPVTAR